MTDGGYTMTEAWNLQLQGQVRDLTAKVEHLEAYAKHERSLGAEGPMMELIAVKQNVGFFIKQMEVAMSYPSSYERGQKIGELVSELERAVEPIMPPADFKI